jgi:hypothetical protein
VAFLGGQGPPYAEPPWRGTLVCDQYSGYGPVLDPQVQPGRQGAGCAAHARRKFEELTTRGGTSTTASPVALEALQRWARIYHVERLLQGMTPEDRLDGRQRLSLPLWDELRAWLQLECQRVAGGAIAQAIDYSLNHWDALTRHLHDGAVPIDNNHLEQQIKPWKLGANNANRSFMRSRASWPGESVLKTRLVMSRRGCGLHIKTGISCGGNPTSGDRHGCVRIHSPGAGSLAARQCSGTARAGLLVPLGWSALRPRNGAHVPLRRRTLRSVVATARGRPWPYWPRRQSLPG